MVSSFDGPTCESHCAVTMFGSCFHASGNDKEHKQVIHKCFEKALHPEE